LCPVRILQELCWVHRATSQGQGSPRSFWRAIIGVPRVVHPGSNTLVLIGWFLYSSYYATIAAGNISFRLAVDTGSSDMFITSTDCLSTACRSIPRYPLKYQSPTFASLNGNATAFNVSYADGTCAWFLIAFQSLLDLCFLTRPPGPLFHITIHP